MEVYESNCLQETEKIAEAIAEKVKNGGFLALYGGMGAGKTSFVRGLVKALCPECLELVHSPTFAIVNEYRGSNINIFHFDLYRLTDEDDLYSTGFYDYIEQGGLTVTEWTELFEESVPEGAVKVKIEHIGENGRRFTVC
ncbi:MAG: tRNA (adenosine(37)-N6)-threonylcarbamoyltransferase complex ATPase subunit type 1 TsaE [Clostridia bacterium]|nr:tRNA (adenosine(37)-N6)-threonylcarbamoyltransferase complex ATPase subunit type 1 TsaE [Clostridia bacterium]MBR5278055.1 tRNA (adenosine(37)-N6)-threonylcarbamoyltransferase complex ATPase subunit type 1 TsaE [Clostridia bacterium]